MFTRRYFVSGVALSTCAVLLSPVGRSGVPGGLRNTLGRWLGLSSRDPRELSAAVAKEHVGESFQFVSPQGPSLKTVLKEVVERPGARIQGGRRLEQYSLVFEGAAQQDLEQGHFVVSHPDQGQFELFVVPAETHGSRREYVASFTRLV